MPNFAAEYFVVMSSSVSMHRSGLDQSPSMPQNRLGIVTPRYPNAKNPNLINLPQILSAVNPLYDKTNTLET